MVTIQAVSVFGAMCGMETFSQLVVGGQLGVSYAVITDKPQYRHRGLLVDSGRRFAPVAMLENIMDGMVRRRAAAVAVAAVAVAVAAVVVVAP